MTSHPPIVVYSTHSRQYLSEKGVADIPSPESNYTTPDDGSQRKNAIYGKFFDRKYYILGCLTYRLNSARREHGVTS
jgi:hypothetical protein